MKDYNKEKTVVSMIFGSHLYGTDTPTSDEDYKSIIIPPCKDIILQRVKASKNTHREKSEGEKNFAGELDMEIFSLGKFLDLVYQGQTVAMDMLFVPKEYTLKTSDTWELIQNLRPQLISRKAEAFVGYCMQQAKKYGIKGSRVDAVRQTLKYLIDLTDGYSSDKLGTYAVYIENFVKESNNEFIKIEKQIQASGTEITFLEVCGRKMSYTASIKDAIKTMQRLLDEYGARALMAEKNEGVDYKAMSHAIRIAQEAIELFNTGNIIFPRPNADELRNIKLGKYHYKDLALKIEELLPKVQEASKNSTLPENINKELIENIIFLEYKKQIIF